MLDHFHVKHDIIFLLTFDQVFGAGQFVIDQYAFLQTMLACNANTFFDDIDTMHVRSEGCHRFRQYSATTTDIQNVEPGEGFFVSMEPPVMKTDLIFKVLHA